MRGAVNEIRIAPSELDALLSDLRRREFVDGSYGRFLENVRPLDLLPGRVARALDAMRCAEHPSVTVIRGVPIDDVSIGDTPLDRTTSGSRRRTQTVELLSLVFASALGEPFGWDEQQQGRIVHDIFPIREHARQQINSASSTAISWHVEDAFHPHRPDYVLLLCLRNPQEAVTTLSLVEDWRLPPEVTDELFTAQFHQEPDMSHRVGGDASAPSSILFGSRSRPYVCVDPYYLRPIGPRLHPVLDTFYAEVERHMRDLVLAPGDLVILDNFRAVHGRGPFTAAYDGRDRWLKRVCVSRDLRRSAAAWVNGDRRLIASSVTAGPGGAA